MNETNLYVEKDPRTWDENDTDAAVWTNYGWLVPLETRGRTVFVVSGDFDSFTDMLAALEDPNKEVHIQGVPK